MRKEDVPLADTLWTPCVTQRRKDSSSKVIAAPLNSLWLRRFSIASYKGMVPSEIASGGIRSKRGAPGGGGFCILGGGRPFF